MTTYAKIRTDAILFSPINNISTANALFVNAGAASTLVRNDNSSVQGTVSVNTSTSYGVKAMQAHSTIRAGKTVSKRTPDGKIMEAESDGAGAQQPVGIALEPFSAEATGNVLLFGPNAPGVLTGLGFSPGDEIYIGETTGGYVNDITPFVGNDDSLIKVGVADCPAGVATSSATDLIMIVQVIARP